MSWLYFLSCVSRHARVKERYFNLPLLIKPNEPISGIRLSSGISHSRKWNCHIDYPARFGFQQLFDNLHEFCQMAFYHIGATFLVCCYPIVVIVLSTSSLSRSESLRWVRFFLPYSRLLYPAAQVLYIISLSFIATMGSSDFLQSITLVFP